MDAQHAIERGIAAAQANNQRTAYYYFYTATQADPNNEQAWLWRASAAPEPRDALFCLAAVLALNPENPVAKHGIEQISAAVAAESPPEPQTITPSLTSDEYKPPERRLAWQQAFQRELYDLSRVPRMQPVTDRTESATTAPPGEIGAAYRRPPPSPGRRATEALRRIIVDRETQRVRLAVPVGIAVLVLLALATFLGLNGVGKPPVAASTTTPAPPPPTLPSSGRIITPAPRRTPAGTMAPTLVAGGPTVGGTQPTSAPTAPPPPAPPTLTPVPPTAVIVVVPTLPPTGPTAVPPTKALAAPTATPVPPTAVAGGPKTVTLAEGQSLQAVAQAQGVSLGALVAYNNIADLYGVAAGTTLKIPPADYKPAEAHYTIRSGDNLTNIARLFGTTVDAITNLNGIDDPNAI
jgi:LysM repeat protein